AERYRREAWERRRRVLGPDHPDTLEAASNLGGILSKLGRLQEADRHLREAVDGRRRILGPENAETLWTMGALALNLQREGKLDEAIALDREILAVYQKSQPDDSQTGLITSLLGGCLGLRGADDEAESLLIKGFEILDHASSTPSSYRSESIQRIVRY